MVNLLQSETVLFVINILNKQDLAAGQINNFYNLKVVTSGNISGYLLQCNAIS